MNGKHFSPINNQDADKVASWLAENPRFFLHYPDLLRELDIPHVEAGTASSLIEYQVRLLRKQNTELQSDIGDLVHVVRENEQIHNHLHHLTIELMQTKQQTEFEAVLKEILLKDFAADVVNLKKINTRKLKNKKSIESRLFNQYFQEEHPFCGILAPEFATFLFTNKVKKAQSAVLIQLNYSAHTSVLAIGSQDENHFDDQKATDLLQHLGEVVEQLFKTKN